MKILIAYPFFYPKIGGVQRYIYHLGKEFQNRGHKVTILCKQHEENLPLKENFEGLRVLRFKPKSNKAWPFFEEEDLRNFLKKFKENFDLVISRFLFFLKTLKENLGSKTIYIAPGISSDVFKVLGEESKAKKIAILEKKQITNADEIIVLSNMMKKKFSKLTKSKITKIPPGVDPKKFKISNLQEKNVIFVGRLSKEKNVSSLIRAFKRVKTGLLIIIGDGPEKENLKKLSEKFGISSRVRFLGWKKNPEKYFRKSSVFVLPSTYESFGHVLLEAMASGLPCLAFRPNNRKTQTASREIIENKKTGFLVKDEKELTEKINLLFSNQNLLKEISVSARKKSKEYSWKRAANKILKSGGCFK